MQNSNCTNKFAASFNQNQAIKKEIPKSNEICVLKPECLIINIESVHQVCFQDLPKINEQQKISKPMTAKAVIKPQKQQNQCLMPTNEYLKLSENQNEKKHNFLQQNKQSTQQNLIRSKIASDVKSGTISCNDYIKLVERKPNQGSYCKTHSKFSNLESVEPKKANQCPYMDLNALENDRWASSYKTYHTWKNNE